MNKLRKFLAPGLAALSLVLLIIGVVSPYSVGDTRSTARRLERRLERRMAKLDYYIARPDAKLPDDMVIYLYSDDTLRNWRGQFPLLNDQVSTTSYVQRLVTPKANFDSPLSYVGNMPTLLNLGPSWYLVKSVEDKGTRTIAGLLITNSLDAGAFGGVNRRLHIGSHFSIKPLNFSEGSPVYLDGNPVFKILYDSPMAVELANPLMLWLALIVFLAACICFVYEKRTLRRALIASAGILLSTSAMYLWGRSVQTELQLFSPMLYAGGAFLYSLAALLLVNISIFLVTLSVYLARRDIYARVNKKGTVVALTIACLAAVVGVAAFACMSLKSVILNSNIQLEVYKFLGLSVYSLLVYLSFLLMLTSIPMLLQMLQPVAEKRLGWNFDMFATLPRIIFAVIAASWLVIFAALLGFRKEEARMEVWAGRLSIDRDINLELQLLRAERRISEDVVINSLVQAEGGEAIIRNRIVDSYLLSASQNCSIGVEVYHPGDATVASEHFRRAIREGVPISDGSVFLCSPTSEGPSRYDGIFRYYSSDSLVYLIVSIEQKNGVLGKGYERLLSLSSGISTTIPPHYSYARYRDGDLLTFRGAYPYPTRMDDRLRTMVYGDKVDHYNRDGYVHFVNTISDDEAVIISRSNFSIFSYIISAILISLLMFLLLAAFRPWTGRRQEPEKTYFRSRISLTLRVSLIIALVVMATVSVVFVFRRNESNQKAIMSDRINAIQLLAQNGIRSMDKEDLLRTSDFAALIQSVSDNTGSDISVYATEGRIVLSTNPEVLDHLILGYRISADVLEEIMVGNKRYCIEKRGIGLRHYYNMYMPLIGPGGRPLAILCAPYVEEGYDFERDAAIHLMTILAVFILLFMISTMAESAILDKVFEPLSLLKESMNRTELGSLEHIEYTSNDEVSALVDAYNRMVDELSVNSRQLAEAERDKAWSEMARQVAHEIKNPLTPMKLQIQRVMYLKQKGDPAWQDKFDEAAKVLLTHIDILTETSNEFSTFARLYTEEHTVFDLDKLLEEEVSMFDNHDNIQFSYFGLSGAMVSGPKPQLTRVFVNILGNAVQAVEGQQDARIIVALRKSTLDGYYDIVVSDNGPGVSEENQPKLFTPNFTTKNGGSGLGLAISRSILQSCGATINYSRAFTLGGACFTITYPALKDDLHG